MKPDLDLTESKIWLDGLIIKTLFANEIIQWISPVNLIN